MLIKYCSFVIVIAISLLSSCSESPKSDSDYMIMDEVVYVDKFPEKVILKNPVKVEMSIIGATKFVIQDSLLIFSTQNPNGLWSFISLPNFCYEGSYLGKGNGPNEFLSSPWVGTNNSFYQKDGQLFSLIYDFQKGVLHEMNINRTLADKHLIISTINDSLPPFCPTVIRIDSAKFFCREISADMTKQERYLLDNGVKSIPSLFEKLNLAAVKPGEDCNILATMIKRCGNTDRFIEMPLKLNYINIYSLDGLVGKTICIGKKLDDISEIRKLSMPDRIYRHGDLRVYDSFFAILCINEDEGTYELGRKKLPSIQFFTIDGEPLVELMLSNFITSFDINFNEGYLYTYDFKSEEFYKYEVADILNNLHKRLDTPLRF